MFLTDEQALKWRNARRERKLAERSARRIQKKITVRIAREKSLKVNLKKSRFNKNGSYKLKLRKRKGFQRKVLDEDHHDPRLQLDLEELCTRIVALSQTLSEREFYSYQTELAYGIVEELLLHGGNVITALMSRQAGKTETLGAIVAAVAIILPFIAKQYDEDWRLNITDDQGRYRGFKDGIRIGIYAPKMAQSEIMFARVKRALTTKTAKKVLSELRIEFQENNGDTLSLTNGSAIKCQSASEQSKIEGETYHLLILEEAQDISDTKIRKSLHPMTSSTLGTIVKIGTASTKKCDFYGAIKLNERLELITGKRNHYFFPAAVTTRYNSLYRRYVASQASHLGEDSDEFRVSYLCEWIFERGMFVTQDQLFERAIACSDGIFSIRHPHGLPENFTRYSTVAGIDFGASSDSTVVTTLAVDWETPTLTGYSDVSQQHDYTHYKKHVLDWLEFIGDNYETQFHAICAYLDAIPSLRKVIMDSNTCGKPLFHRFQAYFKERNVEVEEFNFQLRVKSDGYKSLYGDICANRITFPCSLHTRKTQQWKKFVNQLLDARKEYKAGGIMVVKHPDEKGAHDDYPDSLMLAAFGANEPSGLSMVQSSDSNFLIRSRN